MNEQAIAAGRNMRFEGQHRAEEPADTEARLALVRELETLREAVGLAYGHLWMVSIQSFQNEPGTPHHCTPERAAYEARKLLRDTMTHEQRWQFINRVLALTPNAQAQAPAVGGSPAAQC